MSARGARSRPTGAVAVIDGSPKIIGVALEVDVEQRVLEADGIVIAPSLEALCVRELDGLLGSQPSPGDFFAFDIETSCNAL